jgi:hypothetical protein
MACPSTKTKTPVGLILSVALAAVLCAGCVSTDLKKFSESVRQWVPLGTTAVSAEHIMAKHGFECELLTKDHPFSPDDVDCLDCDREQFFMHDWSVKLFLDNGKVSRYGPVSVDDRTLDSSDSKP